VGKSSRGLSGVEISISRTLLLVNPLMTPVVSTG